jgi:hypothetical protein
MSNKRYVKIPLSRVGLETLDLGYQGENLHTVVVINCAEVYASYPNAVAEMIVAPPTGDLYEAVIDVDDGILTWDITASDTAVAGSGHYQITFTDNGQEIMKSATGTTKITGSLDGSTGNAPTPAETFAEALADELEEQIAAAAETVTPVIVVNCGTISSLPVTLNAEGVTEEYTLIGYEIGTPTLMTSKLTVETGAGTITLRGTKNTGSTTVKLKLIKATRVVDAEEVQD